MFKHNSFSTPAHDYRKKYPRVEWTEAVMQEGMQVKSIERLNLENKSL